MTPSVDKAIIAAFKRGVSQATLATLYGVEPTRVAEIIGPAMEANDEQARAAIERLTLLGIE